jgi:hypothetical protein
VPKNVHFVKVIVHLVVRAGRAVLPAEPPMTIDLVQCPRIWPYLPHMACFRGCLERRTTNDFQQAYPPATYVEKTSVEPLACGNADADSRSSISIQACAGRIVTLDSLTLPPPHYLHQMHVNLQDIKETTNNTKEQPSMPVWGATKH